MGVITRLRQGDPVAIRVLVGGVATARAGFGVAILAAPRLSARISGLSPPEDGAARFMQRAFAVREVALGTSLLADAVAGMPSRTVLALNAATDLSDAVSLLASATGSRPLRRTVLMGMPASLLVTGVWLWARARVP